MLLHIEQRREQIRLRRQQKKFVKQARIRREVTRYLLLGILLLAGTSCFRYLQWNLVSPQEIQINDNKLVRVSQIQDFLSPYLGKPLYCLNPSRIEQQLTTLEPVQYAFVRRFVIPKPVLVVDILEEFPWATLVTEPGKSPVAMISQQGRLIPVDKYPPESFPPLRIYGTNHLKLNAAQVSSWATWSNLIEMQTNQPISYIDMRHINNIIVQDGTLCLHLGTPDSTLTRRLSRLSSVLPILSSLNKQVEYIDLGLDSNIPLKTNHKLDL